MRLQARKKPYHSSRGMLMVVAIVILVVLSTFFGGEGSQDLLVLPDLFASFQDLTYDNTTTTTTSTATGTKEHARAFPPVDCVALLQDPIIFDPNRNKTIDTHRLTTREPNFWISLHIPEYDRVRWDSIMKDGDYYETGITELFQRILGTGASTGQDLNGPNGPLVLDIGMNVGWFTLFTRVLGYQVASFDPFPVMHKRVCESLKLNQWEHDNAVTLFQYGLGESESILNLNVGNNPGATSFLPKRRGVVKVATFPVQVVTLDTVARQEGWMHREIPLMKLDVEGFENLVLRGGQALLHNGNIKNILVEQNFDNMTESMVLFDSLYEAGYIVKELANMWGEQIKDGQRKILNENLEARAAAKASSSEIVELGEEFAFLAKRLINMWWVPRS